jgi:hypothetical protein
MPRLDEARAVVTRLEGTHQPVHAIAGVAIYLLHTPGGEAVEDEVADVGHGVGFLQCGVRRLCVAVVGDCAEQRVLGLA